MLAEDRPATGEGVEEEEEARVVLPIPMHRLRTTPWLTATRHTAMEAQVLSAGIEWKRTSVCHTVKWTHTSACHTVHVAGGFSYCLAHQDLFCKFHTSTGRL